MQSDTIKTAPDDEIEKLREQTKILKEQNSSLTAEFDKQRAKMQKLFLVNNNELLSVKEERQELLKQLETLTSKLEEAQVSRVAAELQMKNEIVEVKRRADEQILSLERLVNESNASQSYFSDEVDRLKSINDKLQTDYRDLKLTVQQTSPKNESSKNLKFASFSKVFSEVFSQSEKEPADDELLKSILAPLDEEIKQLKQKLRSTDEELQQYKCSANNNNKSFLVNTEIGDETETNKLEIIDGNNEEFYSNCETCNNLKSELKKEKHLVEDLKEKLKSTEHALEIQKQDLIKEIGFRSEMEQKWINKREEYETQVTDLMSKIEVAERQFEEIKSNFNQTYNELMEQFISLTDERETVHKYMTELKQENDNLTGKYEKFSSELQNEQIILGDDVNEIREYLFKKQDELIKTKIGQEALHEQIQKLNIENNALKEKIVILESIEIQLNKKNDFLTNKLKSDRLVQEVKSYKKKIAELSDALEKKSKERDEFEKLNFELKAKSSNLQKELETSETVQKDFVRLSQTLQMQLEKIRTVDSQVRWQYKDDVDKCPACHQAFLDESLKVHCRHCGQIFCTNCLTKIVFSGPKNRPTNVCDVCHTLLVQSSAPYFSSEVPRSPT